MVFLKNLKSIRQLTVIALIFIAQTLSLSASSLDGLINDRKSLVQEYDSLISTAKAHPDTDRRVFDVQNRIIAIDNFIINDQFIASIESNKKLEEEYEDLTLYFLIAGAVAAFFLIMFIIFLALYSGIKRKTKRSFGQMDDMHMLLESYKNDVMQLSAEAESLKKNLKEAVDRKADLENRVADYDKRGAANHIEMIRIKSENAKLQEQINKYEKSDSDVHSSQVVNNEQFEIQISNLKKTIEEKDGIISEMRDKIENLDSMLKLSETEVNKNMESEVAMQNELEELKKELLELRNKEYNQVAEVPTSNDNSEVIESLEKEIQKLKMDNDCLNDMVKAAEELQKDLAQEISSLENDVCPEESELSFEFAELKNSFEKQTTEFMKVQQRYEEMHEAKKSLDWKNKVLEEEIIKLKSATAPIIQQVVEQPKQSESPKRPDNLMVEDLMQQNLDLQAELNEFKRLLDDELENRQMLLREFKDLEDFYKDQIKVEEKVYSETDEIVKSDISNEELNQLRNENKALQNRISEFDILFKAEEQARLDLENELKTLLSQFKNNNDLNVR